MGLLAKILRVVPREERGGISLDPSQPFWEVSGETDFSALFKALTELLPQECLLYFEGGAPTGEIAEFLREQAVPERAHVACGTVWPRAAVFHVPATPEVLARLSGLMESRACPELAIHFHVYRGQTLLLQWHDAFTQPMLLSGNFTEAEVKRFCERLGMTCTHQPSGLGPGAPPRAPCGKGAT
jgi:hypothetical protein